MLLFFLLVGFRVLCSKYYTSPEIVNAFNAAVLLFLFFFFCCKFCKGYLQHVFICLPRMRKEIKLTNLQLKVCQVVVLVICDGTLSI